MARSFINITQDIESMVCGLAPRYGDFQKRNLDQLEVLLDRIDDIRIELKQAERLIEARMTELKHEATYQEFLARKNEDLD